MPDTLTPTEVAAIRLAYDMNEVSFARMEARGQGDLRPNIHIERGRLLATLAASEARVAALEGERDQLSITVGYEARDAAQARDDLDEAIKAVAFNAGLPDQYGPDRDGDLDDLCEALESQRIERDQQTKHVAALVKAGDALADATFTVASWTPVGGVVLAAYNAWRALTAPRARRGGER